MNEKTFNRREYLLNSEKCPKKSETLQSLGKPLGNVVLSTLTPIAQKLMNRKQPPIRNPQRMFSYDQYDDYKQSSSATALNNNKKCNAEELKDSLHQHILNIGEIIERKHEIDKQNCIEAAVKENEEFEK